MLRVRIRFDGWTAGPGLATVYFEDAAENQAVAEAVASRVQSAFGNISGLFVSGMTATVLPQVDKLDAASGEMVSAFIVPTPAVINAGAGQTVKAPPGVAALVKLRTGVFDGGRAIAGRIFLSPLQAPCVSATGELASTSKGQALAIATALMGTVDLDPRMVVWRRPRVANAEASPPVTARPGRTANVTSVLVADKLAVLRSRRD